MPHDNPATGDDPLILTAEFDERTQAWFEAKRQQHFPPERNFIPAHLTLFHHLPGDQLDAVRQQVADVCQAAAGPLDARTSSVRFLGFGSAFVVVCKGLTALRAELAEAFEPWLTRQDRQDFKPHVTFQNKAPAAVARETFGCEREAFAPFDCHVSALALWHYRGGPWEAAGRFSLGRIA